MNRQASAAHDATVLGPISYTRAGVVAGDRAVVYYQRATVGDATASDGAGPAGTGHTRAIVAESAGVDCELAAVVDAAAGGVQEAMRYVSTDRGSVDGERAGVVDATAKAIQTQGGKKLRSVARFSLMTLLLMVSVPVL